MFFFAIRTKFALFYPFSEIFHPWKPHSCTVILIYDFLGQQLKNHRAECDIFQTLNIKDFDWNENCLPLMGVLPIRVMQLKESNPDLWQKVNILMDHLETMKDDERLVWQSQVIDPVLKSGLRSGSCTFKMNNDIYPLKFVEMHLQFASN